MCVFVRVQNELFDGDRLAHFFIPLTLASVFRPTALSTASSMLPPVRGRCSYIAMTCQLPKIYPMRPFVWFFIYKFNMMYP